MRCIGRKNGVIFKINFEMVYDKVKWPFMRKGP
jgi:hypothetical protein